MSKLIRIGIIFDGTDQNRDAVAVLDSGVKHELTDAWKAAGYDSVYLLAGNRYDFCNATVQCRGNQLKDLHDVIQKIVALDTAGKGPAFWKDVAVEFVSNGHGGGEGKEHQIGALKLTDIIQELGNIPPEAQRVMRFEECGAANIIGVQHMLDPNDLALAYSGQDADGTALHNFTDSAALGYRGAQTGNDSQQSMFWRGQASIQGSRFAHRGMVFLRGAQFVDRGFGTETLPDPFPRSIVSVTDLVTLIETLGTSYDKGITIVGFSAGASSKQKNTLEQFKTFAEKYPGWVQFLWVDSKTAKEFYPQATRFQEPQFIFHFPGADPTKLFTLNETKKMLDDILHGTSMLR
ncbi:MAG TPA: hypothetical protein DDW49_00790 [Deltaproteobacteria bacterium]|nr:MAG: hypothetical protein A2048_00600 [Deltaproteobacteria bacterium GWA2_45_12]HBF11920.1 hypothetical protein [Deltaproteobacteria bacterium]